MKDIKDIILRYCLIITVSVFMNIFYFIFNPITLYASYGILSIFFSAVISGNVISVNGFDIEMVNACTAGSAYLLLFLLNFSTKGIGMKKRLGIFLVDASVFLVFNLARIAILSVMLVNNSAFFDITHVVFWYALSVLVVVAIWIATVRYFRIKATPLISDIKFVRKYLR